VFGIVDDAFRRVARQPAGRKSGGAFTMFLDRIARARPEIGLLPVVDDVGCHHRRAARSLGTDRGGRATPSWLPV